MLSSWNTILYEYYKDRSDEVLFWGEEDMSYPVAEFEPFLLGVPILYTTEDDEKTIKVHAQIAVNLALTYKLSMITSFGTDDKEKMIINEDISEDVADLIMEKHKKMDCSTKDMERIKVGLDDLDEKYDIKTNNEPFTNIMLYDEYLLDVLKRNYIFSVTIIPIKGTELHKIDVYVRENHKTNTILDREDIEDMVILCRQLYGALLPYRLE